MNLSEAVMIGLVAFIGGIGNRLAAELLDFIKYRRKIAQTVITGKTIKNKKKHFFFI
jgi:hypothetical protein